MDKEMVEVRVHGRGGQGNVVAVYLLAAAAIGQGRFAQAFPNFGAERRGAPVAAFARISERPILQRCQVLHPGYLIIQDQALLRVPGVLDGIRDDGGILINSPQSREQLSLPPSLNVQCIAATALANEVLGRPVPNTALLSAFLSLTGLLPLDALKTALGNRFKGQVLEKNTALIDRAAALVPQGSWEGGLHA